LRQGDAVGKTTAAKNYQILGSLVAPAITGATLVCHYTFLFPPLNFWSFFYLILYSLFYTTIKMSAPGAGHEFPAQEVSWQKRDVLLFANSIGIKADELHFLYVSQPDRYQSKYHLISIQELHPNFSVFPTYSLILRMLSTPVAFGHLH
jgi:hypothetical protein